MRTTSTLSLLLFVGGAFAQEGVLDVSFSGDGISGYNFAGLGATGLATAVQADQKIVGVGYAGSAPDQAFAVLRFNTNGTLDGSFNGGGWVTTSLGPADDIARAVAIQADQKIVVAGNGSAAGFNQGFGVVRYLPNGTLDNSFGTGGIVVQQFGSNTSRAQCVVIQPDGKILVGGYGNVGVAGSAIIARFNTDGSLDASFGTAGVAAVGTNDGLAGYAMALQTDGKVVMTGQSGAAFSSQVFALRLNADGTLDTGFGTGGIVTTSVGSGVNWGFGIAVQTDGNVVVAGTTSGSSGTDVMVVRFTPAGALDLMFDGDGKVNTSLSSGGDQGTGIALQPDGKILVCGFASAGASTGTAILRYLEDGSLDPTFGTNGITITAVGSEGDSGYGLALQADGRVVVCGVENNGASDLLTVYRYTAGMGTGITDPPAPVADELVAAPVPFHEELLVRYTLPRTSDAQVQLLDGAGRVVWTSQDHAMHTAGAHSERIDRPDLAPGVYLLRVSSDAGVQSMRVIKE